MSKVIDGDTVTLKGGERVRLIGINAPEYRPWDGRVDAYGREAAARLRELVEGRAVFLEYDDDRTDRYGRTLAYVHLEDGTFVNLDLVERGLARAIYIAPNGRHYARLKAAQASARAAKSGMWSR